MTDKTDFAALRDKHELALKDLTARLTECNRLNFCMDELSAFAAFSSTVIDQLEAEHQRADDADRRNSLVAGGIDAALKLQARAEKAEAELAELRGEQEPVHYHLHTPATGGNIYYPASQKQIVEAIKDDLSDDVVVTPLFTQQAKPAVVLPKSHYVAGCADKFMSEREVQWAMLAAGIVVKDGE